MSEERVAVLGGSSGIGYATASRLGGEVIIVSRAPERAAAALGVKGIRADISDREALDAALAEIGEVDHLVYTAGEPLSLMPIDGLDIDAARKFFELRYFGALYAVHRARVRRSITLMSGTAALRPGPGWALGASICGAVEGLTRTLAVELAPIRVNAVRPGVTRSPMWGAAAGELTADGVPLGRVGEVEDVAEAIAYLVGQRFTTGTVLTVDGGALLS